MDIWDILISKVFYPQCRGVGEAYAGTLAQEHVLDEQAQADGHFLLQLYEAAVGDHSGKQMPHVTLHPSPREYLCLTLENSLLYSLTM